MAGTITKEAKREGIIWLKWSMPSRIVYLFHKWPKWIQITQKEGHVTCILWPWVIFVEHQASTVQLKCFVFDTKSIIVHKQTHCSQKFQRFVIRDDKTEANINPESFWSLKFHNVHLCSMFLLYIFSQVFVVGSHLAMPNTGRFQVQLGGWSLLIASSPFLGLCIASF